MPGVFASEVAALNFIRTRIARGATVYADEAGAWNELYGRFTMHRVGLNLRATRSLMDFA